MNPHIAAIKRKVEKSIEELGHSPSVLRFLNNTKRIHAICLVEYFRWLKGKGITLNPDELVQDNLKCVYESSAMDVQTKRKRTNWLDEYINRHMVDEGRAHNTRIVTAAAIEQSYKRNDSPLFGDRRLRESPAEAPVSTLFLFPQAMVATTAYSLGYPMRSRVDAKRAPSIRRADLGF